MLVGMEQLLEESAEGRSKVRKPRPGDNPSLSPAAPGQALWALLRSDWEAGCGPTAWHSLSPGLI